MIQLQKKNKLLIIILDSIYFIIMNYSFRSIFSCDALISQ